MRSLAGIVKSRVTATYDQEKHWWRESLLANAHLGIILGLIEY